MAADRAAEGTGRSRTSAAGEQAAGRDETEGTAMMTTADNVRAVKRVTRVRPGVQAVLAEAVLARLGEPADLLKVQVKQVLGRKYRVNVYVRAAGSCRIAHS